MKKINHKNGNPIIIISALSGGLIGYFILHPLAMIFTKDALKMDIILHAFSRDHFYMGSYFVLLGVIFGILMGLFQRKLYEKNIFLNKQKKLLEDSIKEMDALLRILVHDLGNQLFVSANYLEIAMEDYSHGLNDQLLNNLSIILKSLRKSCDLIHKSKDLIKIESGNMAMQKSRQDLAELVSEVIPIYELQSKSKNISIFFENPKAPVYVTIEPLLFQYCILGNLIHNAVKFSYPGKDIYINLGSNGPTILFEVINFGPEITRDKKDKIFSIDSNIISVGTAGEKGTGFGLPMVHKCIELLNGKIDVESNYMENNLYKNIFTISLPPAD